MQERVNIYRTVMTMDEQTLEDNPGSDKGKNVIMRYLYLYSTSERSSLTGHRHYSMK